MTSVQQILEIELIAEKLEKMGDDLVNSGVQGYGLSLKREASNLRSIMKVKA